MKFSIFLAFKYFKPKRSVASAITCLAVLGVMIGVAAVIIVRSVMTGFGDIWEEKILDFKPHVSILPARGNVIVGEDAIAAKIASVPGVVSVTPEIDTRCLISHRGNVLAPVILGVDSDAFTRAYRVGEPYAGEFDLDGDSIVLGVRAARQLGVFVGDEVTVYSPKTLVSKDEVFLPLKWKVTGIFSCGQYEYDSGYVVASLPNLRDLMGMEKGVFAIHVKTDAPTDPKKFAAVLSELRRIVPASRLVTWQEADRELFNALAVEKNMMAILLMLISVVGLFCVMITLLVLTVQKTPEIGLLKALHFTRLQIASVFIIHGLLQCVIGVALGLAAAALVLRNLQNLVDALAKVGVEVFPAAIYGLDGIPHRIIPGDIVTIVATVFVFGLLATLIPAMIAAFKDPVKALNE